MAGRRIDFGHVLDDVLRAVPFILFAAIIPTHLVSITRALMHDGAGSVDKGALLMFLAFTAVTSTIGALATHFVFRPPRRMTRAKLVTLLAVTLFALALAAIDMIGSR